MNDNYQLVSLNTAATMTSLSRTMLNRLRAASDFPKAVPMGERRVAFVKAEVAEWIAARVARREAA